MENNNLSHFNHAGQQAVIKSLLEAIAALEARCAALEQRAQDHHKPVHKHAEIPRYNEDGTGY